MILKNKAKTQDGEKIVSSANVTGKTRYPHKTEAGSLTFILFQIPLKVD
jgi:hypothetical protein